MPFNYEQKYREAYAANVVGVQDTLESGAIDDKIKNFCDLHGFDPDELREEIKSNKFLAACFAINPNKQNFYENVAAEHISQIPCVDNFVNLPNRALYIIDGALFTHKEAKQYYQKHPSRKGESKTVDFRWTCDDIQFYAAHKYTKQAGGAQDNQYKDLQTFIRESVPNKEDDVHFVAIADGDYYLNQNGLAATTKMEKMRGLADNDTVHVCTIDEIETLLLSIIDRP